MNLEHLSRKLFPEDLSFQRWQLMVQLYALAAGLAAGSVDLILDARHGTVSVETLAIAGCIAVVTTLCVAGAFFACREVSYNNARRMVVRLEESVIDGSLPSIDNLGWPYFDRGRDATLRMLVQRDSQIAALQRELDFYGPLAEGMQGLELIFDTQGRLLWVNPGAETLTGHSREACLAASDPLELIIYSKDRPMLREMIAQALQGETHEGIELRVLRKDDSVLWCAWRCYPQYDRAGAPAGLHLSGQNIQPRKDADLKLLETVAALRRAQALKEHYLSRSNDERMRLSALLEILNVGILFVDRERRVVYINQRCADIWQLGSRDAVVGMRDHALLEATAPLRVDADAYHHHVERVIAQREQGARYDIYCRDGRVLREVSSIVPGADGGRAIGRVWIYEDITESLQAQERLTEMAERDPLTDLYNRRRFHEDLERHLADAVRRNEHLGLILFDLDGFKAVNDSFGHHAGDEVLRRIAIEAGGVIRRNELLFRLGGDEFAILIAQPSVDCLTHLARRIVTKIASLAFSFDGHDVHVTISLGIAMTLANGHDAESLIMAADHAMYQAKNEGKNRWVMATRKALHDVS